MSVRLADQLAAARCRQFVGRVAERSIFLDGLIREDQPSGLLYIWGPGGIGKTSLLNEFYCECQQSFTHTVMIDGRNIEPTPQGFVSALRLNALVQDSADPWSEFLALPGRHVLFIDTYELLAPIDAWLRTEFFPQLSDTFVVFAGRDPLSSEWRRDLGWKDLLHIIPLHNLDQEESEYYLSSRGVPAAEQQSVIDFTHGHPLALSLVADAFAQRPNMRFQPDATPDIIRTLLENFVQKVPGPAHRAALEACSLVHWTTETLLADMLKMPDAHDLFEWLRGLSFIESGPYGLFPHDLARETLAADLRWRNPDWYAELHRRARHYYYSHLQQARRPAQQRLIFDYLFLHRNSPVVRPYLEWQESGNVFGDSLMEKDIPALVEMTSAHEGPESAQLAQYWLRRQPQGVTVFRNGQNLPAGFMQAVSLHLTSNEDRDADPAVDASWRYLEDHALIRPGEQVTLFRFWMDGERYQSVSPIQSLIFVTSVLHYLTTPGLAFSFLSCADPDFWAPMFTYASLQRLAQADFEVRGRHFGVYGNDWRAVPPLAWLDMLAEKETGVSDINREPASDIHPVAVLSRPDFASAVRYALRSSTSSMGVGESPLLHSRLVIERVGPNASLSERSAVLQAILRETVDTLQESPREKKLYRALDAGYIHPAATQEQAAEALDLPFSTYRRHVQMAIDRVAGILWQKEIGALR